MGQPTYVRTLRELMGRASDAWDASVRRAEEAAGREWDAWRARSRPMLTPDTIARVAWVSGESTLGPEDRTLPSLCARAESDGEAALDSWRDAIGEAEDGCLLAARASLQAALTLAAAYHDPAAERAALAALGGAS